MMGESGISTYFRNDKIRMRHKTIEDLAYPEYIHLRINEEKKHRNCSVIPRLGAKSEHSSKCHVENRVICREVAKGTETQYT